MPEIGRPSPHKTTHQDSGSDEISLTGLSGLLGDSQTPLAHKTTHQDGGADELNLTDLTRSPVFVNRGDPADWDFGVGAFTTNGAWQDLDLSAIVPAGAIAVLLMVFVLDDTIAQYFQVRKKGNTDDYNINRIYVNVANLYHSAMMITALDSNRKIQYWATNATWDAIILQVNGWWI